MVRFENVGVRYGVGPEVLRDINLHIEPGSFYFLTGASGAGKSSLLKLMYLALLPSRGCIQVFGEDISRTDRRKLPELRRRIGVVFQDFRLLSNLSIFDNVALPLRIAGDDEKRTRNNVAELLDWVGLGARLNDSPGTLSGGEQQRVALARALVTDPAILLLAEPLGSLDEKLRVEMQIELSELQRRLGRTFVHVTHSQEEALTMSDRVAVMRDGSIHQVGSPVEIYNHPSNRFVADFIGAVSYTHLTLPTKA